MAQRQQNLIKHSYGIELAKVANVIGKSKKPNESDFRVHCTLMNVRWKSKQPYKQQQLVEYAITVLNNYCRTHIVQISSVVDDDLFDLSVGFFDDLEAYQFLSIKLPIAINDGTKDNQYLPVISNVFRTYMNKLGPFQRIQEKQQQIMRNITKSNQQSQSMQYEASMKKTQSIQQMAHKSSVMENQNSYQSVKYDKKPSRVEERGKQKQKQRQRQRSKQKQKLYHQNSIKQSNKEVNKIWLFGIPKQYQIDQIKSSLPKYGLAVGECRWRNRQHMQYLEVELLKQISKGNVYYLGLQIQGYPYVALPAMEENEIARELSRYTVQILIRSSEDDEQKFMECMHEVGGVNIMLRTPTKQKNQIRYITVFNNVANAELACRAAKDLRDCVANRKLYELKIGRLCKFYTFTDLMKQHFDNV